MRKLSLFTLFIFASIASFAQGANPASWSYELSKAQVKPGETVELIFRADIQQPWYMYSSDFELDGPMPTEFEFETHPSYELVGDIRAINPKKKYSDIFEGEYTYFTGKAEFRQKVRILQENPIINVEFSYQVCSDKDGKCILFDEDHSFNNIKVVKNSAPSPPKKTDTDEPSKSKSTEGAKENNQDSEKESSSASSKRIEELVKEKEKYISRDSQGRDESVLYLRNFVRKHGN